MSEGKGPAAGQGYRLPVNIRRVSVDRSGLWLAAGWRDTWRAPGISLAYGASFTLISYLLSWGLIDAGWGALVAPLAGGFILIAPILVVGLYDVSRRLETGRPVGFRIIWDSVWAHAGQIAAMGVVLTLFLFVWTVIAIVLFALFFNQGVPALDNLVTEVVFTLQGALFLGLGTAMGAVLAAGIFTISAVSFPLLIDRDVDVVTAIVISIIAVLVNWQVMAGWAAMIALIAGVALVSFFVGLIIALPVLGYATWHAYRDMVEPVA